MDRRELGVDLARGVAVVSMFAAHTAPGAGPADVLLLSEFLTFPLFAMLVGVGAELGSRRSTAAQHAAATAVRATVLLALGWALAELDAQVVIVLAPLGVLTLLCWGLCRLPSVLLLAAGLAAWLVAPWTVRTGEARRNAALVEGDVWRVDLLDLLVSPYYPQAVLVVAAVAGILLVRLLLPAPPGAALAPWVPAVLAVGLLTGCGTVLLLRLAGLVALVAYETTYLEQLFVVALASAVVSGCVALGSLRSAAALRPLAWVGGMTLTLYVLQVLWLDWWVGGVVEPWERDDSWVNLAVLVVGAFVLAVLWRTTGAPAAFRRGPLEGLVGVAVSAATRRVPGARIPSGSGAGVP